MSHARSGCHCCLPYTAAIRWQKARQGDGGAPLDRRLCGWLGVSAFFEHHEKNAIDGSNLRAEVFLAGREAGRRRQDIHYSSGDSAFPRSTAGVTGKMATRKYSLPTLLQQMDDIDRDRRLMAASDLTELLIQDPQSRGSAWEGRVANAFLEHLRDASIDVQANAVRCVSRLFLCFSVDTTKRLLQSLAAATADSSSPVRDLHCTCLKGLLNEMPASMIPTVVTVLMPPLVKGVHSSEEAVQNDALDLLGDLLSRFGGADVGANLWPSTQAEADLPVHLMQLLHGPPPKARRAARCLGGLTATLRPEEVAELVESLMSPPQLTVGCLEALGAVCKRCNTIGFSGSSSSAWGGRTSLRCLLHALATAARKQRKPLYGLVRSCLPEALRKLCERSGNPLNDQLVQQLLQGGDTGSSSGGSSSCEFEDFGDFDPGCSYDEHLEDAEDSWGIRAAALKASTERATEKECPYGLFAADARGVCVQACVLLGLTVYRASGECLVCLAAPEQRPETEEALQRLVPSVRRIL
ncbi:hypothetical protein cyc_09087 [Cyclospora cayetanensis]|uniref:Uncharacterized protein n=1 Tax=Cyclospora cayetanensis TaxID=88456 RepID=A0A1D3CZT4_9EIME|nr:hypothetical protein cyc_09087 [Cyclospora cayetanensis]